MFRRIFVLLLCLALLPWGFPSSGSAEKEQRLIRVGWYETPFNHKDSRDRLSGYAYEYQRKITAYTGWKYEYIEGSWPVLMGKLEKGDIDLMSDVSRTEEREETMAFSQLPMGAELYYLYVSPYNTQITVDDPGTLKGKKVGVTGISVQRDLFLSWAAENGLDVAESADKAASADDVILEDQDCTEEEALNKLKKGELDAFITLDTYGDPDKAIPMWKIGSSDIYFVVSRANPEWEELLEELDAAMSRIQDENKHYNEQLSEKYLRASGTNRFLTAEEKEWLDSHGPIRVGYQDNYLAFCASDPGTGELTGALKDYLSYAADVLDDVHLEFNAVSFPTAAAAMEALKKGEIDCMFPANLTDYDGEKAGVVMSPPLMRTEMLAVVREENKGDFLRTAQVRVGVNRGNPNYEIFLQDHFPEWSAVVYDDTPACLEAVAARNADCIIVSNYRLNDISRQCRQLNLTTVSTGVDMDYCLAVKEGNTELYSILSKAICLVPDSTVNAALNYYSAESAKTSFWDYLLDHLSVVLGAVSAILLVIVILMYRRLRRHRKSAENRIFP